MWWIVFVLLIGVVLAVLFWVGTLTFQGYWYSEPVTGLAWRAPAAGGAIMVFLALWCFVNLRATDPHREYVPYHTIFQFAPQEEEPRARFPFIDSYKNGKKTRYELRKGPIDPQGRSLGGDQYVEPTANKPWRPHDADGKVDAVELPFPDRDKPTDAKAFQMRKYTLVQGQADTYRAENGQTITADDVARGQITRFRWDILIVTLLMTVLSFAVAFAVLWLLLRFQWPHALGLAVIVWLVLTLGVLPPLFSQVHDAAKPPLPKQSTQYTVPSAQLPA